MSPDRRPRRCEAVRAVVREALDRDADWAGAGRRRACCRCRCPRRTAARGSACARSAVLLRETGARAVHLPVWETLCCGALTLAAAGTDEQQQALLPGVATGEALLTPALREVGAGITGAPGDDVRRRHGDRPQDRRHLRRRGRPRCS